MEEVKNEILILTDKLKEKLETSNEQEFVDLCQNDLYDLQDLVKKIGNEQITQKFEGLYKDFIGEKTTTKDNVLNHLDIFKDVVEKNITQKQRDELSDKLNSETNEKNKIYDAIEQLKYAIICKDMITFDKATQLIRDYTSTTNKNDEKRINDKIIEITNLVILSDFFKNITEEKMKKMTEKVEELSKIVDEIKLPKKEKVENKEDKKALPKDLAAIRKEMDTILGKSLFEGIENEYEFAISYQLDEHEIDKFQALRSELKELLTDPVTNKSRIDDIRVEMFVILGVDPYTYKDNKKLIDNLEEPNKSRFAELKAKHDELLDKKNKKNNSNP